jgi:hypothetical protein
MDIRAILDFRVNGVTHAKIGQLWNGRPNGENSVIQELKQFFKMLESSEDAYLLSNASLLASRYFVWKVEAWAETTRIKNTSGLAILSTDPPDYEYKYFINVREPVVSDNGNVEYPIPSINWEKLGYLDGFYPLERKFNSNRFYDLKLPNLLDIVNRELDLMDQKKQVENNLVEYNWALEDELALRRYITHLTADANVRAKRHCRHERFAFPSSAAASVLKLIHEGFCLEDLDGMADYVVPFLRPDQDGECQLKIAIAEALYFLEYRNELTHLNQYISCSEEVYAIKNRYFSLYH